MGQYSRRPSLQQQRCIAKQVQRVDANHFFNLLTGPQLLDQVEALLPEHRERTFPPTVTLAMFLAQAMRADESCQNAVNQAVVGQLLSGMAPASVNTGGDCQARARLPLEMIKHLAQQASALLNEHTPKGWLWRGRQVKLVAGTNVSMPDTSANQLCFPQPPQQKDGIGYPLARLVGIVSLSNGAILNGTIGCCRGKGTGEHSLFRQIEENFTEGDVMLADGYFCSYWLIAAMISRNSSSSTHRSNMTDATRAASNATSNCETFTKILEMKLSCARAHKRYIRGLIALPPHAMALLPPRSAIADRRFNRAHHNCQ